jgi:hypothetical protein
LFLIFDEDGIVLASEGAAGVVALFLADRNLAIQTHHEVHELGIAVDVSFRVLPPGEFLEQNLRELSGSGLEAYFGQLRRILAAEEIQQVILVEAVLEDVLLGERPFEVTARGPA